MQPKRKFSVEEPRAIGGQLDVKQSVVDFAEFRRELQLELEHGVKIPEASDEALLPGKIAWANLKEFPDANTRWTDAKPKRVSSRQRKG
ncbi:hypothetical protein TFLX_02636 [Thermoflexales bacterium]|nr:hypothetical protein TFLX_02636 [Thermoflexales bacterium]